MGKDVFLIPLKVLKKSNKILNLKGGDVNST
jgi:hypothetical protein